jgi:N-acyl-D-amino-acid deacylase
MAATQWDLLIRGATVYDGSGSPPTRGDIAVLDDRIVAVGDLRGSAGTVLEAGGLAVAPGFIDVHSHDDFTVFVTPEMDFKIMQGVTTDVVGNCGMGAAPYAPASLFARALHPTHTLPEWQGYGGYLGAVDQDPPSLNVAALVGHGTLRAAAMADAKAPPGSRELDRMRGDLREGLEAGCVGYSTGLIYEPGRYARTEELLDLAAVMSEIGGLYATHMRDEGQGLLDSVREAIAIGEGAGVPVQISHHKASGRPSWGLVNSSLRLIEEAQARGVDVTADQYPYTSGSTILAAVVQNGGLSPEGAGGLGRVDPSDILIASCASHPEYEGKTVDALREEWGVDAEAAGHRILDEEPATWVVMNTMDEADVRTVMKHPTTMIGSDGIPTGGKPHPRLYGTFPRVLGRYARKEGILSLEVAIHRMTGLPATKFRLDARGFVREGAYADLVLFDPARILDSATYEDPRRYPDGILHVLVNGTTVVKDGRHTGARPGRTLRRAAKRGDRSTGSLG